MENNSGTYDFEQHLHNYAVWTAARARNAAPSPGKNFKKGNNFVIKKVIEASELRDYIKSKNNTQDYFDEFHKNCSKHMIELFNKELGYDVAYGIVAKIIAIYLKTSVILVNSAGGAKSNIIHPPIDSIILKKIVNQEGLEDFQGIKWYEMTQEQYWDLVDKIRKTLPPFNWELERYWSPEDVGK